MTKDVSNKITNMALLCSFLVVLIHCRPQFEVGSFSWWVKQMLEEGICTIAVPFFFVVSGFMLSRHIGERGWWLKENRKRVFSLLFPYLIWSTLYFVYGYVLTKFFGFTFALNDIMQFYGLHYGKLPGLTPLWYIRGLLVLFVLSPLLALVSKFKYVGLLILFILYGIICPGPSGEGWVHALTRNGILPAAGIFYFTTGLVIGQHPIKIKFNQGLALSSLCIGLFLSFVQASFYYWGINQWTQYWGWLAIPFMMAGVWGLISNKRWIKWLVSTSFPIYLIHKFFIPNVLTNKALTIWPQGGAILYLFVGIVVFAFSLGAAIIVRKIVPKANVLLFGGR